MTDAIIYKNAFILLIYFLIIPNFYTACGISKFCQCSRNIYDCVSASCIMNKCFQRINTDFIFSDKAISRNMHIKKIVYVILRKRKSFRYNSFSKFSNRIVKYRFVQRESIQMENASILYVSLY